MKWVKLIGGRFLDFLITSAVVTLICVGLFLAGYSYLDSTRLNACRALKVQSYNCKGLKLRLSVRSKYGSENAEEKRKFEKLERQLGTAITINYITTGLTIVFALFGFVSVLGIVFRRGGLTQREGFVRVWIGVPKYLGRYFAGYFRKSNAKGE